MWKSHTVLGKVRQWKCVMLGEIRWTIESHRGDV